MPKQSISSSSIQSIANYDSPSYRENRYFTPWGIRGEGHVEDYYLESIVGEITGQAKVKFGDGIISTKDTCFGCETCEELFTPAAPVSCHIRIPCLLSKLEGIEPRGCL